MSECCFPECNFKATDDEALVLHIMVKHRMRPLDSSRIIFQIHSFFPASSKEISEAISKAQINSNRILNLQSSDGLTSINREGIGRINTSVLINPVGKPDSAIKCKPNEGFERHDMRYHRGTTVVKRSWNNDVRDNSSYYKDYSASQDHISKRRDYEYSSNDRVNENPRSRGTTVVKRPWNNDVRDNSSYYKDYNASKDHISKRRGYEYSSNDRVNENPRSRETWNDTLRDPRTRIVSNERRRSPLSFPQTRRSINNSSRVQGFCSPCEYSENLTDHTLTYSIRDVVSLPCSKESKDTVADLHQTPTLMRSSAAQGSSSSGNASSALTGTSEISLVKIQPKIEDLVTQQSVVKQTLTLSYDSAVDMLNILSNFPLPWDLQALYSAVRKIMSQYSNTSLSNTLQIITRASKFVQSIIDSKCHETPKTPKTPKSPQIYSPPTSSVGLEQESLNSEGVTAMLEILKHFPLPWNARLLNPVLVKALDKHLDVLVIHTLRIICKTSSVILTINQSPVNE